MEYVGYLNYEYVRIPNHQKLTYFKSLKNGDAPKVKTMYNTIKTVLSLGEKSIMLEVADRTYKFTVIDIITRSLGCTIYYLPAMQRLDIFSPELGNAPLVQILKKQIVYSSYNWILNKLGVAKLFNRLISAV